MNSLPVIESERIILRPITMEDTDHIVEWRNNPDVRRNFIYRGAFDYGTHAEWMKSRVETGDVIQYIIEEKPGRRPIGSVYYRDISKANNSAEFGIFIGEDDARDKGYGRETTKEFINFGLHDLGFHRIMLRLLSGNDAAYKSYLDAGFRQEGVFRDMVYLDGEYRDVIFMAVVGK